MSYFYKLKSHPSKLLKDHIKNVGANSFEITNSKFMDNKEICSVISYLIGISHDFGKSTTYFQKKLMGGERTKYTNHGFISALFSFFITKSYLEKIDRLESLWYIPFISWIAVKRHHGNLGNIDINNGELGELDIESDELVVSKQQIENIKKYNFGELYKIYEGLLKNYEMEPYLQYFFTLFENDDKLEKFIKEIKMDGIKVSRQGDLELYFLILFFYSVLLDSDKLDASNTLRPNRVEKIQSGMIDEYKKGFKKFSPINQLREASYEEVMSSLDKVDITTHRLLSLELPTGMGKTLTGLAAAIKLRNKISNNFGFYPKIIYSLPFLSIIDQNSDIIEEILKTSVKNIPSNLFLKHHHLAEIRYTLWKNNTEDIDLVEELDPAKSILLTESWHAEIVMTTFVQFFESIITNRNKAARKFHNIVNSVIILDEVQAIPVHYWNLINKCLKVLANKFYCTIIFMTATKPLIFEDAEIFHLIKNKSRYYNQINRVSYNFTKRITLLEELEAKITEDVESSKNDIMCVLNTIGSCKCLYRRLKKKYPSGKTNGLGVYETENFILINLSTHIIPKDRLRRIKLIKNSKKRKVIVTTQLIEAGVDISVDKIYRDMAPLDCIIQASGRCNRENKPTKGSVEIVKLVDEKTGRDFSSYIYDNTLIGITKIILEKSENFDESQIKDIIERYFQQVREKKSSKKSKDVMGAINKLYFYDSAKFRLIEELKEGLDIIVELDKNSTNLIKKLEEKLNVIKGAKGDEIYIHRAEANIIKRKLNNYTLSLSVASIPEELNVLEPFLNISSIRLLNKDMIKQFYEKDTGLNFSLDWTNVI